MIVEMNDVWKRYGRNDALRGLSFSVPEGSAFALIGPNGAGKTTTIKVLMNLISASRGQARVLGTDLRKLSPKELAQIGYVSENQDMPQRLTVAEYIAYLRPFYPTWDRDLEATILHDLHLPPDRKIGHLSHGMRLKMALACALPYRPKLLVLDEPFSGLDALVRDEFMDRLLRQADETTILISSHELAEIENVVTDVAFIEDGKLHFQEPMDALKQRLRKIRVTLERPATLPASPPPEWLDIRAEGNVLTFVDTQFSEPALQARVAAMAGVRDVSQEPIALRSIFTSLARAARAGRG